MTLYTKCILAPVTTEDGFRVSVMSRHTQNDGRTPDWRLAGRYDQHWPALGPPPQLIGRYLRGEIDWLAFEKQYLAHLAADSSASATVDNLVALLQSKQRVTILCIEESPEHCHRRLLAEECKRRFPVISTDIF